MFNDFENYIQLSREERRNHLKLDEPCILIGGRSRDFRGLLAHYLKTTIPKGRNNQLCHACNVEMCSNTSHMYWGTNKDNHIDRVEVGSYTSFKERIEAKYTQAELDIIRRKGGQKLAGRKIPRLSPREDEFLTYLRAADTTTRGWISKASRELNISHTHVKRLHDRLLGGL